MDIDLLQIKIEEARKKLPKDTVKAIDAVPWKTVILGMRETKGYTFEQLGDLETETELLLCGLLTPEEYPKELEWRMRLPKARVTELVNDMNQLVFTRIREELVKLAERKKVVEASKKVIAPPVPEINPVRGRGSLRALAASNGINKDEMGGLDKAGIQIIGEPDLSKL